MRQVAAAATRSTPGRPCSPCAGCSRSCSPPPARGSTTPRRCARRAILARHAWSATRAARSVRRPGSAPRTRSARSPGRAEARGFRDFCRRSAARPTRRSRRRSSAPPLPSMLSLASRRRATSRDLLADHAVPDAVGRARPANPRPPAAPVVRPLRHLLRLLALPRAGDADAGRACRAAGRLVRRRRHACAWRTRWPGWPRRAGPTIRYGAEVSGDRPARGRASRRAARPPARPLAADAVVRQRRPGGARRRPVRPRRRVPRCRRCRGRAALALGADLDRPRPRPRAFRCCATTCSSRATTRRSSTRSAAGALPAEPTVYVCAQDRDDRGRARKPGRSGCSSSSTRRPMATTHEYGEAEIEHAGASVRA